MGQLEVLHKESDLISYITKLNKENDCNITSNIVIKIRRAVSPSSAPHESVVNNSNYIICRCRSESKSVSVINKDM